MSAPERISLLRNVAPSPAVKTALRLLVSGACKTKKEAARAVGLHPAYLTQLTNESEPVKALLAELDGLMTDKTVDMSVVMSNLGRMGIARIAKLALAGSNERIQLDAAKTLADRSPETAGIQKIQAEGLSLGAQDAKVIAEALVESARLATDFDKVAREGLVEVDITQGAPNGMQALPAPKGSASEGSNEDERSAVGSSDGNQGVVQELSSDRKLELLK